MLSECSKRSPIDSLIEKEKFIHGVEAMKLSGMQDALIEELDIQNQYFGTMMTLRVSDPNHLPPFNGPGFPKPSSIYSKTSQIVGGYIPVDPIFTRLDVDRKPLGHHYHDDIENQESVQVKWTLYEIIQRCNNSGDLVINWSNIPIVKITFKPNKGPLGFNGEFVLNLGEEKSIITDVKDKRIFTRSHEDPTKHTRLIADIIAEQFNIEEFVYYVYPIYYKKDQNDSDEPLKALKVFAKDGIPIIGDWDKDLESMPLDKVFLANKEANKEFNTFNSVQERRLLLTATKKLFEQLCDQKKPAKHSVIRDFFSAKYNFLQLLNGNLLARAGCITPYELLRNMLANYFHNENSKLPGYYPDPFQHGPEHRNPFVDSRIKSDFEGSRFHIYQGNFIYTINEDQRIKLYLVEGFLETNFIHIHPLVNMEKWCVIIEKQVNLGQWELISPKTMEAYFQYQATLLKLGKDLPNFNMDQWHFVITAQLAFSEDSLVTLLPMFNEYLTYCSKVKIENFFTPLVLSSTDDNTVQLTPRYNQHISSLSSGDRNIDESHLTPLTDISCKSFSSLDTKVLSASHGKKRISLSSEESTSTTIGANIIGTTPKRTWVPMLMTEVSEELVAAPIEDLESIEQHLDAVGESYYLATDRRKNKVMPRD